MAILTQELPITASTATGIITSGEYAEDTAYAWMQKSSYVQSDKDIIYENTALGKFICEYTDNSYTYITYTSKWEKDESGKNIKVDYINEQKSYTCITYCYTYYWTQLPDCKLCSDSSFEFYAYNYVKPTVPNDTYVGILNPEYADN